MPVPTIVPHGDRARDHMPCLDGLRGLAAVVVVLGHAGDFGLPSPFDARGRDCGVLIFFALSGFLMGDLYLLTPPTRARLMAYGAARIARIVPIYYLVVIAAFVIHSVDPAFAYAVTPVQFVRLLTFNGSVSVFWSIGPEMQFYAVFVVLWVLRGRLQNDGAFAVVVLAVAVLCVASLRHWPGTFVASKFHIFALGMLAALLRERVVGHLTMRSVAVLHGIAVAVILVFLTPGVGDIIWPAPFDAQADPAFTSFYGSLPRVCLAAILPFAFSFQSRPADALLANPLAALLGRCSFSIYLLHVAVYDGVTRSGLLAALPGWTATLAVLLATILLSRLTYAAIEAPARSALRAGLLRLTGVGATVRLRSPA